jgi:hypothetical protein
MYSDWVCKSHKEEVGISATMHKLWLVKRHISPMGAFSILNQFYQTNMVGRYLSAGGKERAY